MQRSQPKGRIIEFLGMDSEDESDLDIEFLWGRSMHSLVCGMSSVNTLKYASKHTGSEETSTLCNHFDALQDDQLDIVNDLNG